MKQINFLKFPVLAFMMMFLLGSTARAQLSGTYTVGGTSPDYTTLSAAVSALNSNGVNGPVTFLIRTGNYSGNSWRGIINNVAGASATNTITFRSQTGVRSDVKLTNSSSNNYIFRFNNCKYVTVKDMTFIKSSTSYGRVFDIQSTASYNTVDNCVLQANATTSSSNARALVYALNHTGTDNTFTNCEFKNGGTWAYLDGTSTSSTSTNFTFENNTFSASNSNYYGFYMYYTKSTRFANNEFSRTGSGYFYLFYSYYENNDFEFIDNTVDIATNGSYLYGFYNYYCNYSNGSTTETPVISGNDMQFTNTSSYTYPFYSPYMGYLEMRDNVINSQVTTGRTYYYGPSYYGRECVIEENVFNLSSSSSGYGYTQYFNYDGNNNWNTEVSKNVFNFNCRYNYNYVGYYGNTKITENEYNLTTTTGTNYNYLYYGNGMEFAYNKINTTSSSGTTYGLYDYGTTSYSGANIHHNEFNLQSTSGTIYGAYPYYSTSTWSNNLVVTKTSGTNYTLRANYCYDVKLRNNTFHSNATGSTNYVAYIYTTSSSYKATLENNIISKSGTKGYGIYIYNKNYYEGDHNLFHVAGGTLFYSNSPSLQDNSLQQWRNTTNSDMNSLVYEPPYIDAAGGNFNIDPSSPGAWAVNGRAFHDTTIKTDLNGNTRPKFVQDGVPDLGAYEVSPTSTPPNAVASPAAPVANSTQVFTFGEDTVATIDWGATVPSTYTMRQYTGVQAGPMPTGVGRMFFYVAGTPSAWVHQHTPNIRYKDSWIGDIPAESDAVIARSSNAGAWEGYNYTNAATDIANNILLPAAPLDSIGSYTGVQNGRIGIRCVENPKGIVINNITANEADIEWQPVFNPIGYQVVLKGTYEAPSTTEWANSSFPTTNSLAASGLTEDTKYYVFVRSICGINDTSGYSADSFTTLITCHDPVITVSDVTDSRAVISWQNVKTAVKYEYVMTKSSTPPAYGTDINKTSVLAPFLDPGTEYYVHVRAHCSSIYPNSNWSSATFMTEWPSGINDINAANGLSVYPNPVNDEMIVLLDNKAVGNEGTISVIDMTGKVLFTQLATGNKTNVDVSILPAGMYIVQYANANDRIQMKFNKQ